MSGSNPKKTTSSMEIQANSHPFDFNPSCSHSQYETASSGQTSSPYTTIINASHYRMLTTGNLDDLKQETSTDELNLFSLFTEFDNSSALHIAALAGQVELIRFIVEQFNTNYIRYGRHHHQHPLLHHNGNGDLPVHVAVRSGKNDAAMSLVNCARVSGTVDYSDQMLETENYNGDTPLHIALENRQKDMAKYLFRACPQTFYRLNEQNICPLYLAIKAAFWELVQNMLDTRIDIGNDVGSQLDKGKVIHAAIMAKNLGVVKTMLEKYRQLSWSYDEKERRPLSHAAYIGFLPGMDYLIENYPNIAFGPDRDGSFPIHWACRGGNIQVIKALMRHSGDMMWLLNKKGQNILHVAAESGKAKVTSYILGLKNSETLVNMKDEDGNTPLHLASKARHPKVVYALTWDHRVQLELQNKRLLTALDIAEDYGQLPSFEERLTWLALINAGVPRAPIIIPDLNEITYAPVPTQVGYIQTILQNYQNPEQIRPSNKYKERLNTLLVVSTLVATVTFASGFTVPGGYNQDNPDIGMAVLAHSPAFQAFVISDTIALFSSLLATIILIWAHLDDLRLILFALDFVLPLLAVALVGMSVAFMTGLYVTLKTKLWLGILVLVMGGSFLGVLLLFITPFFSPVSPIKYKLLRYFFHIPFKLMLLACDKPKAATLY